MLSITPSRSLAGEGSCDSTGIFSGDDREVYQKNCVDEEGDLWVVLELDDWLVHDDAKQQPKERMFTVRLSWPASTPADFAVSLFPYLINVDTKTVQRPPMPPRAEGVMYDLDEHRAQQSREAYGSATSRRMFARIRASNTRFVRAPNADGAVFPFQFSFLPRWVLPAPTQVDTSASQIGEVRFLIILEPLTLDVLPESILPGVMFLVALLLIVGKFGLPTVNAAFSKLANRARKGKGKWNH